MGKTILNDNDTDIDIAEDNSDDLKDPKANKFFAHLQDLNDYIVRVYKHDDKKKKLVDKFINVRPDEFTDIRDKWGGGTYSLYCHKINENTEILIDTCQINLGDSPDKKDLLSPSIQHDPLKDVLTYVSLIKELMGTPQNNNNDLILKMIESQNLMSEKLFQSQLDSERRMMSLIKEMSVKTNPTDNLLSTIDLIERLKESADPEKPFWEKMLNNPAVVPILSNILNGKNDAPAQSTNQLPSKEQIINTYINNFPEELLNKITDENKNKYIQALYDNNKGKGLTFEDFNLIVNTLLAQKTEG